VTMKRFSAVAIALVCLFVVGLGGIANCQTWSAMNTKAPVSFGTELLLTDGRVLLHEESGSDFTAWWTLTPDITGSYINGTWTQVASLPNGYAPLDIASAVLADGKVVVDGGEYQCPAGSCTGVWQANGAIFDPVQNTWTALTCPPGIGSCAGGSTPPYGALGDAESVVLSNGTWMLAACCSQYQGYTPFPDYFYFNENTLNFTTEASANDGETTEFDEAGWNLLPNGQVLMVNVYLGSYNATAMGYSLYNPSDNTWTQYPSTQVQLWDSGCGNSATASYELGPGVLMPNGTVFYAGASNCQAANYATYNWSTNTWTAQGTFPGKGAMNDAPAAIEINGNVILDTAPYTNTFSGPVTFYEWNGTTLNTFPNPSAASKDDAYYGHLLVLPTGQIMYTDWSTTGVAILTSAGTYQAAWQPTISTAPTNLTIGQTYPVSGTQFNGLSQGGFYGDDFQDATNYPLVRIVTTNNNHVYYAKTHGHSTMGVATGSTPVSTNFDVPVIQTADLGPCNLYVVANGIPSVASPCTVGQPLGIYSPVNGTPFTSASVTFEWGGDPNATAYWVDVGSTEGGNNYYQSGSLSSSTLSLAVANLPNNGSTVYVTWYEMVNGNWVPTSYSYTAVGNPSSMGNLAIPVPGTTLTSASSVTFMWSRGTAATAYWLEVGTTPSSSNIYSSGSLASTVQTAAVKNLPSNGSTVYVTLLSLVGGGWISNSYTYTAINAAAGVGSITTPTPGSTLTSSTVTFDWTAGSASAFALNVGSTPGGNQYYQSGNLKTALTTTVKTLPTNGSMVYVTLFSTVGGVVEQSAYTYTAVTSNPAQGGMMSTPTPGSILNSSSVTFTWTAGNAASVGYWLDISQIGPGQADVYSSGNLGNVLTTTVNGLPTNGNELYITLFTLIGNNWVSNAYTYYSTNTNSGLATLTNTSPLIGSSVNFTWNADANATGYWLDISAIQAGGNDLDQTGNLGNVTNVTINNLPANGGTIYTTLWSLVGGQWLNTQTTFISNP
jgi:hypothetical protein